MTISAFESKDRAFVPYPAAGRNGGQARIARLIGRHNSTSLSGGVVVYERLTVDWDLPFDEMITVIEGNLTIQSGGETFSLGAGDVAWFPAHTQLTYDVPDRVTLSYAIWPQP